jgi:hypothetical protein
MLVFTCLNKLFSFLLSSIFSPVDNLVGHFSLLFPIFFVYLSIFGYRYDKTKRDNEHYDPLCSQLIPVTPVLSLGFSRLLA